MNYELAKKLKEAGYPFREIKGGMCLPEGQDYFDFNPSGNPKIGAQHFYCPTLSELIEACGDKFYGLHKMVNGEWLAFMYDIEDSTRQVECKGNTAEEAVSNLWLELNEK